MGNIEMNVPASEEIRQRFEKYNYFFCVDNRGFTIEQDTQVRKIACEMGGEFCVYKNSAIKSSIEGMSFAEAVSEILEGPTAVAFFSDYDSALGFYEETGNSDNLQEELGDLLLQVVMHSQIAKEEGLFDFEDVAKMGMEVNTPSIPVQ